MMTLKDFLEVQNEYYNIELKVNYDDYVDVRVYKGEDIQENGFPIVWLDGRVLGFEIINKRTLFVSIYVPGTMQENYELDSLLSLEDNEEDETIEWKDIEEL